jgi:hypothetical protein
MHRTLILVLCAAAALSAQNPDNPFERPPANVDRALRERITQFYQFHVDRQYKKAEALVAPDTRNYFYAGNKPAYLSFEIVRLQYSDRFTRATAVVNCEQFVPFPEFAGKPVRVPTPSTWKLEHGKWYWYVDQQSVRDTPFGRMTPGPSVPMSSSRLPATIPTNPAPFLNLVKPDKNAVALKPGSDAQVTFSNTAPGNMSVTVDTGLPGIEAKFDHGAMKVGDKTVLILHAGEKAASGTLNVRVEQTGELIPIKIDIQQ